jgi:phosphoribosyl-AMP cyclohydrolase
VDAKQLKLEEGDYLYKRKNPDGMQYDRFASATDPYAMVNGFEIKEGIMNEEAWDETCRTKHAVYYSRSRKKLWRKGEESGNVQIVKEILVDCDFDSVVFKIEQIGGAACHTGHRSCYFNRVVNGELVECGEQVFDPEKVYKK